MSQVLIEGLKKRFNLSAAMMHVGERSQFESSSFRPTNSGMPNKKFSAMRLSMIKTQKPTAVLNEKQISSFVASVSKPYENSENLLHLKTQEKSKTPVAISSDFPLPAGADRSKSTEESDTVLYSRISSQPFSGKVSIPPMEPSMSAKEEAPQSDLASRLQAVRAQSEKKPAQLTGQRNRIFSRTEEVRQSNSSEKETDGNSDSESTEVPRSTVRRTSIDPELGLTYDFHKPTHTQENLDQLLTNHSKDDLFRFDSKKMLKTGKERPNTKEVIHRESDLPVSAIPVSVSEDISNSAHTDGLRGDSRTNEQVIRREREDSEQVQPLSNSAGTDSQIFPEVLNTAKPDDPLTQSGHAITGKSFVPLRNEAVSNNNRNQALQHGEKSAPIKQAHPTGLTSIPIQRPLSSRPLNTASGQKNTEYSMNDSFHSQAIHRESEALTESSITAMAEEKNSLSDNSAKDENLNEIPFLKENTSVVGQSEEVHRDSPETRNNALDVSKVRQGLSKLASAVYISKSAAALSEKPAIQRDSESITPALPTIRREKTEISSVEPAIQREPEKITPALPTIRREKTEISSAKSAIQRDSENIISSKPTIRREPAETPSVKSAVQREIEIIKPAMPTVSRESSETPSGKPAIQREIENIKPAMSEVSRESLKTLSMKPAIQREPNEILPKKLSAQRKSENTMSTIPTAHREPEETKGILPVSISSRHLLTKSLKKPEEAQNSEALSFDTIKQVGKSLSTYQTGFVHARDKGSVEERHDEQVKTLLAFPTAMGSDTDNTKSLPLAKTVSASLHGKAETQSQNSGETISQLTHHSTPAAASMPPVMLTPEMLAAMQGRGKKVDTSTDFSNENRSEPSEKLMALTGSRPIVQREPDDESTELSKVDESAENIGTEKNIEEDQGTKKREELDQLADELLPRIRRLFEIEAERTSFYR